MILAPFPTIELSEQGDAFRSGGPLSVDVLVALAVQTVGLVALREMVQAGLALELGQALGDQVLDSEEVVLSGGRVTSKGYK